MLAGSECLSALIVEDKGDFEPVGCGLGQEPGLGTWKTCRSLFGH